MLRLLFQFNSHDKVAEFPLTWALSLILYGDHMHFPTAYSGMLSVHRCLVQKPFTQCRDRITYVHRAYGLLGSEKL